LETRVTMWRICVAGTQNINRQFCCISKYTTNMATATSLCKPCRQIDKNVTDVCRNERAFNKI